VALSALAVSACGSSSNSGGGSSTAAAPAASTSKPVTITFWEPFTGREEGVLKAVVANFEKQYPNIKVKMRGSIADTNIIAAIRGGSPPDLAMSNSTTDVGAYCGNGGWINLNPYIQRDGVNISSLETKAAQDYTQFQGVRCALPALADAYGLYYNKTMLAKAGITSPPKTFDELTADAKKLTVFNPDGSIKVAGFVPSQNYYENAAVHYAPLWNAHWDTSGKSSFAADPGWTKYFQWDKALIDWYGASKLTRFLSKAGNEFSPTNDFETGRIAMNLDGEWRVAFVKSDGIKNLAYGTAPMPVDPAQPQLYGAGYTTGNVMGIPKGAANPAAAWLLAKYIAFNTSAVEQFAEGLDNVPTIVPALNDPVLSGDPHFLVFLKIFGNPSTSTDPVTAIGSENQTLEGQVQTKWENGSISASGLAAALKSLDSQIDGQVAQSTVGKVP
jgi:multiple sugar transport system substrate-binding protein